MSVLSRSSMPFFLQLSENKMSLSLICDTSGMELDDSLDGRRPVTNEIPF